MPQIRSTGLASTRTAARCRAETRPTPEEFIDDVVAGLPSHPDDYGWDDCSEVLFQDHDILLLADPGVEDPTDQVNQFTGLGDLRPDNWFTEFSNVDTP
jgi:hypothetical protein